MRLNNTYRTHCSFHCNNSYANAPRYVIRTLPVLLCLSPGFTHKILHFSTTYKYTPHNSYNTTDNPPLHTQHSWFPVSFHQYCLFILMLILQSQKEKAMTPGYVKTRCSLGYRRALGTKVLSHIHFSIQMANIISTERDVHGRNRKKKRLARKFTLVTSRSQLDNSLHVICAATSLSQKRNN
jgi:hypothetical protein